MGVLMDDFDGRGKLAISVVLLAIAFLNFTSTAAVAARPLVALQKATSCDGWSAVKTLRTVGRHEGNGLDGEFQEFIEAASGRFLFREHDGPYTSAVGYDGGMPWSQDFTGGSHAVNASSARALARTRSWLSRFGWCRVDSHASGERLEVLSPVNGRDVLRVIPLGGAPVRLELDRTTHLPVRSLLQLDESREITEFGDWRDVDGLTLPFQRRIVNVEDNETLTYTTTHVEVDRVNGASPSRFAQPPLPADVRLPPGVTETRVPYILDGDKPIVNVTIDGEGPFPFVLDTGGHFIVTAATARRVGLRGAGSASSVNQNMVTKVGFARIQRLGIGKAFVVHQVAEINPYGFAKLERGPRPPKAGWLGLELLERFALTLDPVSRTLTLRPLSIPRPAPSGVMLPLRFTEDAPLVDCTIFGAAGECMLDTGNAGPTIVAATWALHHSLVRKLARGVAIGETRLERAPVGVGPFLRKHELAEFTAAGSPDAERTTATAATFSERLIDGFITTFDYARGVVVLRDAGTYRAGGITRTGVLGQKRRDGTFLVRSLLAASPAITSGIRRGDVVLALDGHPARRLSGADYADANADVRVQSHTFVVRRNRTALTFRIKSRTLLP